MNKLDYWDSCIFIRYLLDKPSNPKEQEQLENIKPMFVAAHKGDVLVIVSTLVLAEIRPKETYNQRHVEITDDLFYRGRSNVRVVAVTPPIARRASELGALYPALTMPDAVHIATALLERASTFYTLDGDADGERRRSGKLLTYHAKFGDPFLPILVPPPPKTSEGIQPPLMPSGPMPQ